jgi:hypothetical protein
MGFLLGFVRSVAANIIFGLLLEIVFWAITTAVARRFSRFFGLYNIRSIAIYLSNLWSPELSRRKRAMLSLHELRAAQSVDQLFTSAPLRLPELVRGLVDAVWPGHPVRCVVEVSPPGTESADLDRNLVIVGSSARNSLRASYIRAGLPSAYLTDEIDTPDGRLGPSRERSISIWRNGHTSGSY